VSTHSAKLQNQTIRVLSASTDPHLNRARAMLLEYHGFQVTTSESKEAAHREIQGSDFDILIFGSTLPRDTCWELAAIFRDRNSRGKIIEIIPAPWATPKNRPDATVVSSDEPSTLINVIRGWSAESL
jgi:CheY-like chemotaxis protein